MFLIIIMLQRECLAGKYICMNVEENVSINFNQRFARECMSLVRDRATSASV